jgi:hypothetical protein
MYDPIVYFSFYKYLNIALPPPPPGAFLAGMGHEYFFIYTEKLKFSSWCTGYLFLDDFNQFIKREDATVVMLHLIKDGCLYGFGNINFPSSFKHLQQ